MPQSEAELEQNLIKRLTGLGYEPVTISSAAEFNANLKAQLEKHNQSKLSDTEFKPTFRTLTVIQGFLLRIFPFKESKKLPVLRK